MGRRRGQNQVRQETSPYCDPGRASVILAVYGFESVAEVEEVVSKFNQEETHNGNSR